MASRIVLGSRAKEDVQEYFAYIAAKEKSQGPAHRWYRDVMSAILDLKNFSERHPFIPEVVELGREIRESFIHSHRIIFSVNSTTKSVFVHRVYHSSRPTLRSSDIGEVE